MEKLVYCLKKEFKKVNFEIGFLRILVLVSIVWNLILTGCFMGNNKLINDVIQTDTVSNEVQKVWELQEIPESELK